jgi:hypothetical protein
MKLTFVGIAATFHISFKITLISDQKYPDFFFLMMRKVTIVGYVERPPQIWFWRKVMAWRERKIGSFSRQRMYFRVLRVSSSSIVAENL